MMVAVSLIKLVTLLVRKTNVAVLFFLCLVCLIQKEKAGTPIFTNLEKPKSAPQTTTSPA